MGKRARKKVEPEPEVVEEAEPEIEVPAIVEVSVKAKLLAILKDLPVPPPPNDPIFFHKYIADYMPQINNWKARLREQVECLS